MVLSHVLAFSCVKVVVHPAGSRDHVALILAPQLNPHNLDCHTLHHIVSAKSHILLDPTRSDFYFNSCTMDIDDLLAEVAVDTTPQETRDLQELTRCWVAERVAPEILPWPSDLMDRVQSRIRRQVCWSYYNVRKKGANGAARLNQSKTKPATWIQRQISS